MDGAKNMQNGQGKCIRYIMSTPRGKVEIIGSLSPEEMIFKFHQAKDPADASRIFTCPVAEDQGWLDL